MALTAFLLISNIPGLVRGNFSSATSLPNTRLDCQYMEGLWVEAQSVPSAAMLPCVRGPLPVGWTFAQADAGKGLSVIPLDNDRAGTGALRLILTAHCRTSGAAQVASAVPGLRRYQAPRSARGSFSSSWYDLFPGGCVTIELHSNSRLAVIDSGLPRQAMRILGYVPRGALQQELERRSGGRLHLN